LGAIFCAPVLMYLKYAPLRCSKITPTRLTRTPFKTVFTHFPVLALVTLAGCGFTPLYGQSGNSSVAQKLDTVAIANIPDRTGQMLRLSLETQLHTAGAPTSELYNLTVNYSIGVNGIGVQADTSVTRNRFTGTASWALAPIGTPSAPIATGTASTEDAENIIDQQYFALQLETDTVNQQLADTLAAQITSQVAAYFKTHPNS
jgi:LPS-assembly lipoprotein